MDRDKLPPYLRNDRALNEARRIVLAFLESIVDDVQESYNHITQTQGEFRLLSNANITETADRIIASAAVAIAAPTLQREQAEFQLLNLYKRSIEELFDKDGLDSGALRSALHHQEAKSGFYLAVEAVLNKLKQLRLDPRNRSHDDTKPGFHL